MEDIEPGVLAVEIKGHDSDDVRSEIRTVWLARPTIQNPKHVVNFCGAHGDK